MQSTPSTFTIFPHQLPIPANSPKLPGIFP